jgi:uncharacterized protein (DUF1919 family)
MESGKQRRHDPPKTRSLLMGLRVKLPFAWRRKITQLRLRTRDFSIVSNNCWGAHIYQCLGEEYRTPFIGLFLAPPCYVKLVPKLRWYLGRPIRFVERSRHEYINQLRQDRELAYPIGCLGDEVEIQFLHYKSEAEALAKWNRRVERMSKNDERLFFKFCDRDGCSAAELAAFDGAAVAHKVCFVSKPHAHLGSACWIPGSRDGQVPDGMQLSRISPKYFDAASWLNGHTGHPKWWVSGFV